MSTAREMEIRQAYADHAGEKKRLMFERGERTKAITSAWKEGFAALKAENDRLQIENKEKFHEGMVNNDNHLREELDQIKEKYQK